MKIYNLPQTIKAIIFDIDSTLYTNSPYAFEQVDCQVRAFAKLKGITSAEARKMVAESTSLYRDRTMCIHDRGTEGEDRRRDHSFERTRDDHTQMEGGVRIISESAGRGHGRFALGHQRLRVREA